MNKQNRRSFLQISTGALATGLSPMPSTLSHGIRLGWHNRGFQSAAD